MENTQEVGSTTVKTVISLPADQVNLAGVSKFVAVQWATKFTTFSTTFVTLIELQTISTRFSDNVSAKSSLLGKRKILSQSLLLLCKNMDKSVPFLKSYLKEEFGPDIAKSYYQSFGLLTEGSKSKLPSDRDKRILSLQNIVDAMTNNLSLGTRKYGLTYWTEQLNELQMQWQTAKQTDSQLSALTEQLHIDAPVLKKHLAKIKQLIKINSGDTYRQAWRDWGFQTEKYK